MGEAGTTTLTREELYALIWAAPLKKVGEQLGISGTDLGKLCSEYNIARPDQGHWTRLELGMSVTIHALEPPRSDLSDRIEIVRKPARPPRVAVPQAGPQGAPCEVPEVRDRLVRPHPLVAEWIATREKELRAKETVYSHSLKRLVTPVALTPADRRRHLVADAIFKAVEARGVVVKKGERFALQMIRGGERIEFQIRYRLKRGQRPRDARELHWREPGAQNWRYELYETDSLVFEIKTWLPRGSRAEWEDSKRGTIEEQLGDIIEGIMASFPALENLRREREEEKRRHERAAQERYRREEERRLDRARFRRLLELVTHWREAEVAREFLATLREAMPVDAEAVGGIEAADWLAWAERKVEEHDRLTNNPRTVLEAIAAVTSGTYRD